MEGRDFVLLYNFKAYRIMLNISWAQNRNWIVSSRSKSKQKTTKADGQNPSSNLPASHQFTVSHKHEFNCNINPDGSIIVKLRTEKVRRAVSVQTNRVRQLHCQTCGRHMGRLLDSALPMSVELHENNRGSVYHSDNWNKYLFQPWAETPVEMKRMLIYPWRS